ncbi:hypothetical protein FQN57_001999 [Myotisia sp. PD_48]|nr:hypothetical protein FQN57_001999 [Myotisia sp. PD_48]
MPQSQRRGPWVPEEDQALLELVHSQGASNWVQISQHMKYRSPKQCRERFHQNLKPTLNHDPISPEEGLLIEHLVSEMGKRWAEIARRLGNRSDNAVKNWWNGSINRKRRGVTIASTSSTRSSRATNGKVEPPYQRSSAGSSSPIHSRRQKMEKLSYGQPPPLRIVDREDPWASASLYDVQPRIYSSLLRPMEHIKHQSIEQRTEDYRSQSSYDLHHTHMNSSDWAQRSQKSSSPSRSPRHLSPIFTNSSINMQSNPPMTSPAFSEVSHVSSIGRPPSMISDHNSVASASPKTVSSPSVLPLSMEILHPINHHSQNSYDERRRGSAPVLHSPSGHTNHHNHQSLLSGKAGLDPSSDYYRSHPLRQHQYSTSAPINQLPSLSDVTTANATRYPSEAQSQPSPATASRDSRMGLKALLN